MNINRRKAERRSRLQPKTLLRAKHAGVVLAIFLTALTTISNRATGQSVRGHTTPPELASQPAPEARFEVASVKRSGTMAGDPGLSRSISGGPGTGDPGMMRFQRVPLKQLLRQAYGVAYDQIEGPDWLEADEYTIVARLPPGATKESARIMLQNLLKERFGLVLHTERKEFPSYTLSIAKGGHKLKGEQEPVSSLQQWSGPVPQGRDGFREVPSGYSGVGIVLEAGSTRLAFRASSIEKLIYYLGLALGANTGLHTWAPGRISDETGLTGRYDFKLAVAGNMMIPKNVLENPDLEVEAPAGLPNLFTALEKQLGLKLAPGKTMLDVLIVDHAERTPAEN